MTVNGKAVSTSLEAAIGYKFKDKGLLTRALTHSSYSNESGLKNHHMFCNERLEFLGDSVLSLITSNYLYAKFSDCPEGELTRMREPRWFASVRFRATPTLSVLANIFFLESVKKKITEDSARVSWQMLSRRFWLLSILMQERTVWLPLKNSCSPLL